MQPWRLFKSRLELLICLLCLSHLQCAKPRLLACVRGATAPVGQLLLPSASANNLWHGETERTCPYLLDDLRLVKTLCSLRSKLQPSTAPVSNAAVWPINKSIPSYFAFYLCEVTPICAAFQARAAPPSPSHRPTFRLQPHCLFAQPTRLWLWL